MQMQMQQSSTSIQNNGNQQHQRQPVEHQQHHHWSSEAYPSDSNISEGSTGGETQSQGQNLTPPQPACSPMPQHHHQLQHQSSYHNDSCYHQHQPYQQVAAQQQHYCPGCGIKAPMTGSATCSRRCSWLCNHQCPQCGKPKPDGFVYCSRTCSYQSTQANWCSACGVCQTDLSGFCVNLDCVGAQPSHQQQQQQQQFPTTASSSRGNSTSSTTSGTPPPEVMMQQGMMMMGSTPSAQQYYYSTPHGNSHTQQRDMNGVPGGRRGSNSKMECRVMNTSEISRSGIPSVFSAIFAHGLGTRLVSVLKLTSSAIHRKKYLAYRSIVENQMASVGASKYGHGGEGNEQRRYFGIPLCCNLGRDVGASAPPAPPSAIGGGSISNNRDLPQQTNLRTCQNPTCVACSVVTKGLDLYSQGVSSHYCNTTSTAAVQYLEPSPTSGLKAMMVARVVVGNPEVHYVDQNTEPPFIQAPQDSTFNHSMVLTNNDTNYDGTYIFSDEAVDPQYLVFFE